MPDCIRLGIAPIYLSFTDIRDAVAHLRAVMEGSEWAAPSFQRARRGDLSRVVSFRACRRCESRPNACHARGSGLSISCIMMVTPLPMSRG